MVPLASMSKATVTATRQWSPHWFNEGRGWALGTVGWLIGSLVGLIHRALRIQPLTGAYAPPPAINHPIGRDIVGAIHRTPAGPLLAFYLPCDT